MELGLLPPVITLTGCCISSKTLFPFPKPIIRQSLDGLDVIAEKIFVRFSAL